MRNLFKSRATKDANGGFVKSTTDIYSLNVEVGSEVVEEDEWNMQVMESRQAEQGDEMRDEQQVDISNNSHSNNNKSAFLDSWLGDNNVITDQENGMVAMFNELWHEIERNRNSSLVVGMVATDPDDSMVAMFREIGTAAKHEIRAGRRVLTAVLLMQMEWAIHQAVGVWNKAGLLTNSHATSSETRTITTAETSHAAAAMQRGEGSKLGHTFYEI